MGILVTLDEKKGCNLVPEFKVWPPNSESYCQKGRNFALTKAPFHTGKGIISSAKGQNFTKKWGGGRGIFVCKTTQFHPKERIFGPQNSTILSLKGLISSGK